MSVVKWFRVAALVLLVALVVGSFISEARATSGSRRVALVVGTNDGGSSRTPLRYATSDAQALSRVLEELGGLANDDRVILTNPSRSEFQQGLEQLAERIRELRSVSDRIEAMLYFSGHSNESGLLFGEDSFSFQELRRTFATLQADVRIAIVDSCSSGLLTRTKGGRKRAPLGLDESASVKGSVILTSASATEAAQESDAIGASFFTHYLVSGLRGAADVSGDGRVTLTEAYRFAYDETLRRTERTQVGAQHANYEFRLAGRGDLVLTDVRNTAGQLRLDDELDGRLFIRDAAGRLVVEVNKLPDREISLGLEPGMYYVTLSQPARLLGGEIEVGPDGVRVLGEGDLSKLDRERVAMRGDDGAVEEVEVYYGLDGTQYDENSFCFTFFPGLSTCPSPKRGVAQVTHTQLSLLLGWSEVIDGVDIAALASLVSERVDGTQVTGMLAVNNGRLDGVQVSGSYAMTQGSVDGVQLSGLLALTLGDLNGVQMGSLLSYIRGDAYAAQLSGVLGITSGDLAGFQGSGALSINGGDLDGVQIAGATSITGGSVGGTQIAGAATIASGGVDGTQIAGALNVSGGPVSGAQVGVINVAWGPVQGSQVGLINIAERYDGGGPIGLLNFVKEGQLHLDLWSSDIFLSNLGIRFGSENVYTRLSFGTQPELPDRQARSGLTLGVGVNFDVSESTWLAFDVGATGLAFSTDDTVPLDFDFADSSLYDLRGMVGFELFDTFSAFAGLSLNTYVDTDGRERRGLAVIEGETFGGDDTFVRLWPGFFAGLQL